MLTALSEERIAGDHDIAREWHALGEISGLVYVEATADGYEFNNRHFPRP
jgi:hypothetical protein